jgi:CelD/BcsL family acetyltransferase involved in cellulose biosynthesis
LLLQSPANTVFLTWEWLYTWFKHLGGTRRLQILRLSCGEETFGLAPLAVQPRAVDRLLGVQAAGFLGAGRAGADYLDFIIRRDWEDRAIAALERFATDGRLMLRLAHIRRDGSAAAQWAAHMERQGWQCSATGTTVCPFVRLTGHSWGSYLETLSSEHRYNVRRKLRNLSRDFDVQFERVTSESQCREALSLLIGLHNRRWNGRSSAFNTPRVIAFHEEFTQLALARDWLRLYVLRLNGKPAASLYGLYYNEVFYFYQSGFDPAYAKHSVGLAIMALTIKAAIEEGAREYDLLRGDEPYKFHWAKTVKDIGHVYLCPGGSIGTVYQGAAQLRQGLGRLARRVLTRTLADAIAVRIRP